MCLCLCLIGETTRSAEGLCSVGRTDRMLCLPKVSFVGRSESYSRERCTYPGSSVIDISETEYIRHFIFLKKVLDSV